MEPVGTDVDERVGIDLEQSARDNPRDEDPVITRPQLAGDFGVEVGHRPSEHGPALRVVAQLYALERVGLGRESAAEVADQHLATDGELVEGELATLSDPVGHVAVASD